jgi:hypothetical protein
MTRLSFHLHWELHAHPCEQDHQALDHCQTNNRYYQAKKMKIITSMYAGETPATHDTRLASPAQSN